MSAPACATGRRTRSATVTPSTSTWARSVERGRRRPSHTTRRLPLDLYPLMSPSRVRRGLPGGRGQHRPAFDSGGILPFGVRRCKRESCSVNYSCRTSSDVRAESRGVTILREKGHIIDTRREASLCPADTVRAVPRRPKRLGMRRPLHRLKTDPLPAARRERPHPRATCNVGTLSDTRRILAGRFSPVASWSNRTRRPPRAGCSMRASRNLYHARGHRA